MNNITWGRLGKEEDNGVRDFYWRYCADGKNLPSKDYEKTRLLISEKFHNSAESGISRFLSGKFVDANNEVIAWAPLPIPIKLKEL